MTRVVVAILSGAVIGSLMTVLLPSGRNEVTSTVAASIRDPRCPDPRIPLWAQPNGEWCTVAGVPIHPEWYDRYRPLEKHK